MYHLNENNSLPFVHDAGSRHIHISQQVVGGEEFALSMKAPMDDFGLKLDDRKNKRIAITNAGDSIWLCNSVLGDIIRKTKRRALDYDQEHIGAHTVNLIFPDGNISDIIEADLEDAPAKAHEVAEKITSLGASHPLFPLAAEITAAVDNYKAKIKLREDAEDAYRDASIAAELSKAAVIKQYNNNYFSAGKKFDKAFAEKLFPRLSPKTDDKTDDDKPTK